MPNIRVRQRLDKLCTEINKIAEHVALYSGIDAKDSAYLERILDDIATTANQIKEFATAAGGREFPADTHRRLAQSLKNPVHFPK